MSDAAPDQTHARALIDRCLDAHRACLSTAAYAVDQGRGDAGLLQILHDAADVTLATAHMMMRASRFHRPMLIVCDRVMTACAEVLDAREHDDAQMRTAYAAVLGVHGASEAFLHPSEGKEDAALDEALRETFPGSDTVPPPTEL